MGCRTRNAIVGCLHTGRRARPAVMLQNKISKVNISVTCQGSRAANCSLRAVQSIFGSSHDTAIKNRPRGNISRRKNGLPMTEEKTRVLRFKTLLYLWLEPAGHWSAAGGEITRTRIRTSSSFGTGFSNSLSCRTSGDP